MMADDRNDVVLEARRQVESDSLEDITNPEYFKVLNYRGTHLGYHLTSYSRTASTGPPRRTDRL
jgi:hypothetical protein